MPLVLGTERRCPDDLCRSEFVFHRIGVVRWLVVQKDGDRRPAGGGHAVLERLDDGGSILVVPHGCAGDRARAGVDHQLDVERERLVPDHEIDRRAVTDPLGVGEECLKLPPQPVFVRRPTRAALRETDAVARQDLGDQRSTKRDAPVMLNVATELGEAAFPGLPHREDRLDLRLGRIARTDR